MKSVTGIEFKKKESYREDPNVSWNRVSHLIQEGYIVASSNPLRLPRKARASNQVQTLPRNDCFIEKCLGNSFDDCDCLKA